MRGKEQPKLSKEGEEYFYKGFTTAAVLIADLLTGKNLQFLPSGNVYSIITKRYPFINKDQGFDMCCGNCKYGSEVSGKCPDCGTLIVDGEAQSGCNCSQVGCKTCGVAECDMCI